MAEKKDLKKAFNTFLETKVARLEVKHKAAICAAAAILPLVLFFFLVYSPKTDEIKKLERRRTSLTKEIASVEATARELDKHEAEMAATEAKFAAASVLLPQQKEIPSLLTNISALGTASGLDFISFTPNAETPQQFYAEIPVSIQVRGPYHNVGRFLYEISRLPRIVTVNNISMGSPSRTESEVILSTSFQLVTYRFLEPSEIESQTQTKKGKKKRR